MNSRKVLYNVPILIYLQQLIRNKKIYTLLKQETI